MNKSCYRKPQAVKDLERLAHDRFRTEHPNFPEYAIPPQSYRDDTANGLTRCVVDFVRFHGGQAERINTTGVPEQRGGRIVWRKSNTTKGSADISATIAGRSVKMEIKIGADLCNDPNDLHESEALVCELMRWSCEYDNHILCVLHSNPGGDKARGHLGSALLRKSETVMLVKADGDTSVVSPQYCRNEPFTEFAFRINAEVLPELCSIPAPQPKENVFAEVMVSGKVYTHSELVEELMKVVDLKEGSAKSKISRAVKAETIVKNQVGGYYLSGSQIEVSQPELHDEPF